MPLIQIEQARLLRNYCEKLGREGMAKRVLELAKKIVDKEGGFGVSTMEFAGMIRALCIGAKCDSYWDEKQFLGYQKMVGESVQEITK